MPCQLVFDDLVVELPSPIWNVAALCARFKSQRSADWPYSSFKLLVKINDRRGLPQRAAAMHACDIIAK